MDWKRPSQFAGAGAAFVMLIAWMVPPTTPKPPAEAAWRANARSQQASAAPQQTPTVQAALLAPGYPPVYAANAGRATPPDAAIAERVVETDDDVLTSRDEPADTQAPPVQVIRASAPTITKTIEHRDADADGDVARYHSGYAWASARDVQDVRECREWRGDAGEDGCIDYLRDQDRRDERRDW